MVYSRDADYDALSLVTHDETSSVTDTGYYYSTTDYVYETSGGAYMGGALVSSHATSNAGPDSDVTNTYVWYDGAQIASSEYQSDSTQVIHHAAGYDYWSNSYLPAWDETVGSATAWTSDYVCDAQGHLRQVDIADGQPRTVTYVTNLMGEVMKRWPLAQARGVRRSK